jgi:hypothetical protein
VKDYPSVAEYAEEFLRRWFAQVNVRTLRNITPQLLRQPRRHGR